MTNAQRAYLAAFRTAYAAADTLNLAIAAAAEAAGDARAIRLAMEVRKVAEGVAASAAELRELAWRAYESSQGGVKN